MNILLIQPAWASIYGKFRNAARRAVLYPPLGILYIATIAKSAGHNVRIVDAEVEDITEEKIKTVIQSFQPDLIGVTTTSPMFQEVKKIALLCKKYSAAKIVLGGPHVTIVKDEIFKECPDVDFLVVGEGEETFMALLENDLSSGKDPCFSHIPGALSSNGNRIHFAERPYLKNLDALPFPDRSLLKNESYYWSIPHKGKLKFTTMLTSRGCPFKCTFCSEPYLTKGIVRRRSPENVVEEIKEFTQKHGLNMIYFMDDTFTLHKEHTMEICELIIRNHLKVFMDCHTHANCVNEKLLRLMKKAGFLRVCFGVESGDENVLKATKKSVTLERLQKAFTMAKKAGLETCGFAIVGLPYDTKETVEKTISFMRNLKDLDYGYFSIASPLPGTEMYEMAKRNEGGVRLLSGDVRNYQRYDASMLSVNDLSSEDLIKLQKKAFLHLYLTPRRIFYMIRRSSIKETLQNAFVFLRSLIRIRVPAFKSAASPISLKETTLHRTEGVHDSV